MAEEEPLVRGDVELGLHAALAVLAALAGDQVDPVHHEHRRGGQLGVARTEHLAAGAGQQVVIVEAGLGGRKTVKFAGHGRLRDGRTG